MNNFKPGDRVRHEIYGKGTVIYHKEGNHNSVPLVLDSGFKRRRSWGFLASPEFLTKIEDLVQENE